MSIIHKELSKKESPENILREVELVVREKLKRDNSARIEYHSLNEILFSPASSIKEDKSILTTKFSQVLNENIKSEVTSLDSLLRVLKYKLDSQKGIILKALSEKIPALVRTADDFQKLSPHIPTSLQLDVINMIKNQLPHKIETSNAALFKKDVDRLHQVVMFLGAAAVHDVIDDFNKIFPDTITTSMFDEIGSISEASIILHKFLDENLPIEKAILDSLPGMWINVREKVQALVFAVVDLKLKGGDINEAIRQENHPLVQALNIKGWANFTFWGAQGVFKLESRGLQAARVASLVGGVRPSTSL